MEQVILNTLTKGRSSDFVLVLAFIFIVLLLVKLLFLVVILSACIEITMLLTIGYSPNLMSKFFKQLRLTRLEKFVRMTKKMG